MRIMGVLLLVAGLVAAFGLDLVEFDLPDYQLQPISFALIAVGGIMVVLGGRRQRKLEHRPDKRPFRTSSIGYRQPEPEPEKHKPDITWGRDGDKD